MLNRQFSRSLFSPCGSISLGKGGDQLIPVFVPEADRDRLEPQIKAFHKEVFHRDYLPRIVSFAKARELLVRVKKSGRRIVLATSSHKNDLAIYKRIVGMEDLVEEEATGADAQASKPEPDIFARGAEEGRGGRGGGGCAGGYSLRCAGRGRAGHHPSIPGSAQMQAIPSGSFPSGHLNLGKGMAGTFRLPPKNNRVYAISAAIIRSPAPRPPWFATCDIDERFVDKIGHTHDHIREYPNGSKCAQTDARSDLGRDFRRFDSSNAERR
jgi:hypothetical protein